MLDRHVDRLPDDPAGWVWLRQVHGREVVTVDGAPGDAARGRRRGHHHRRAAARGAHRRLRAGRARQPRARSAVVHAGWPGLEQGVLGAAVDALRALSAPVRSTRVLGPCVHPARYEFGADLLDRLVDRLGPEVAAADRRRHPRARHPGRGADLARPGRRGRTSPTSTCAPSSSPDHFSHRRDGVTGRQAVVVVRTS